LTKGKTESVLPRSIVDGGFTHAMMRATLY